MRTEAQKGEHRDGRWMSWAREQEQWLIHERNGRYQDVCLNYVSIAQQNYYEVPGYEELQNSQTPNVGASDNRRIQEKLEHMF